MKVSIIISCLAFCIAVSEARMAFRFASGIEDLLDNVIESFTCTDKIYGYYADIQNDCKVFHICNPIVNHLGEIASTEHFSFMCPNQTIFSQDSLSCVYPEDSIPCEESHTLYDLVNSEFGQIVARDSRIDNGLSTADSDASASALEGAEEEFVIFDVQNEISVDSLTESPEESKLSESPEESKLSESPEESKLSESPEEPKSSNSFEESKPLNSPEESKSSESPEESKESKLPESSEKLKKSEPESSVVESEEPSESTTLSTIEEVATTGGPVPENV